MTGVPRLARLPRAVAECLDGAGEDLRHRRIERIRLDPLVLRAPIETLLERRRRLFNFLHYERTEYGFEVSFRRQVKASREFPVGRECKGAFRILTVTRQIVLIVSDLREDDHNHGPKRFTRRAYPLARRPFVASTTLVRLIEQFGASLDAIPTAGPTHGYHRRSRSYRRDSELQSPAAAAREMVEQDRYPHRMWVSYRRDGRKRARVSFDRNCCVTVLSGSPLDAVKQLILPGVSIAISADKTYELDQLVAPIDQEVVELTFRDEPFDSFEAMNELCYAVRRSDGLNVAVIHLNPYLHAQVLDFLTGAAIDMLVTDCRSVSLVPRSGSCGAAIQRIATTIFHHFGEGESTRAPLAAD